MIVAKIAYQTVGVVGIHVCNDPNLGGSIFVSGRSD